MGIYRIAAALAIALVFAGCGVREETASPPAPPPSGRPAASEPVIAAEPEPQAGTEPESPPGGEPESGPGYIDEVVQETVLKFARPGMSEFDKAKAAFDHIIETSVLDDPVGLELWRIRGNGGAAPSFVENRSLSVLLHGVGMCEDYAAALTMLLRGMGLEAKYVPGLTYAADGSGLVDHAWTVAKIDGVWYHLDCQLEQNISRRDTVRYRYFMRGDATLAGSHRWGRGLADAKLLTAPQNEELLRDFLYEPCPEDYPTPPPYSFTAAPKPDLDALQAAVDAELQAYEALHGPLEPLELNVVPPVFGTRGYPVNG